MKKAAVLLATGYEEGEALFIVDILRRADMVCDIISTEKEKQVMGSHQIIVEADLLLTEISKDYDMVILPGGMPGAENLKNNKAVIDLVQTFNKEKKWIAAICAAPIVLHEANIITGKTITSYPGEKYEMLFKDAIYTDEIVVVDANIVTSRGPATTFAFAYKLVDVLGGNSQVLKEKMLYQV